MDVIAMPQLGETVTEGTILTWLKQPGDAVEVDDGLFEVSTEKVDTEVPSAVSGVLRVQLVDEGETVPIGTPVAVITSTADEPLDLAQLAGTPVRASVLHDGGIDPADTDTRTDAGAGDHEEEQEEVVVVIGDDRGDRHGNGDSDGSVHHGTGAVVGAGRVLSPVVRRLLDDVGLSPDDVVGSGRDGRITRADVAAAAALRDQPAGAPSRPGAARRQLSAGGPAQPVSPSVSSGPSVSSRPPVVVGERDEVVAFSRSRASTAAHMVESLATSAHALVALTVDYVAIDAVRRSAGLSYLPFVARAVVEAIAEFPHLNASVIDDEEGQRLVVHRDVNLGIAVDVDREALVVPVVHGAEQMRIGALSDAMDDLAERARRRRLAGDALSGGTFTITNVGAYGTLVTMPIINQPQVAILSTDGVRMTPVAVPVDEGSWGIAVHPVGNLCLSFDHRAFDGAYAAAFMARVRAVLEERDWATEVAP